MIIWGVIIATLIGSCLILFTHSIFTNFTYYWDKCNTGYYITCLFLLVIGLYMTINYNVEYIAVLIADLLLLIFDEPFIVVIRNTYHYILYRTVVSEEDFNFNCSTKVSILRNRLGDIKAYLINNKLWIAVDYDYNNGYKIVTNYVTHIHTRKKI